MLTIRTVLFGLDVGVLLEKSWGDFWNAGSVFYFLTEFLWPWCDNNYDNYGLSTFIYVCNTPVKIF